MDLSKALDCLLHDLNAVKLLADGMLHEAVRLLMSFLRDRKQRVRLGEHTSEWMTLLKGVPQGSILGPCLFNLFLHDLIFALKHTALVNYADDNTICAIANSFQEAIQKLVADGNIAIERFTHNDMPANTFKFHMHKAVLAWENVYTNLENKEDKFWKTLFKMPFISTWDTRLKTSK